MRDTRVVVRRETERPAPAERVWQAMLLPRTMLYVRKGRVQLPGALDGRIDAVVEGETGTGWVLLFHVVPLAKWTINVVRVIPRLGRSSRMNTAA